MGTQSLRPLRLAVLVAIAVIVLDQLTKVWAVAALDGGPIGLIDGFLQLRLTLNPGAAFSSFQGVGPLLGFVAVGVVGWIIMLLRQTPDTIEALGLALVLGGALGNLIDRVLRGDGVLDGAVVDFIDFSFFPTFNVADSAITIGALLLVFGAFRRERKEQA